MTQTTTTSGYQITTSATASDANGNETALGALTQNITAAEAAAGKYQLESLRGAACRIARDRHMDQVLETLCDGYLLEIYVDQVKES